MVTGTSDLAHVRGANLEEVDFSIGELLRRTAAAEPHRIALLELRDLETGVQRAWSYAALLAQAEAVGQMLALRFAPGDRVAIWSTNRPEWTFLQFGAALAGMVIVAINPSCRADDLAQILRQSGAVALFHHAIGDHGAVAAMIHEARAGAPALRHVETLDSWAVPPVPDPNGPVLPVVAAHSPALIQFTSGTTGNAKGAVLTHHALVNSHMAFEAQLGLDPGSVLLNSTPMSTIAGSALVTLTALWNRGTHLLLDRYLPDRVFRAIEEERANWTSIVPTQVTMLLEDPGVATCDFTSLKAITSGGAPVSAELARKAERLLRMDFCMIYGQTEAGCAATHGDRRKDPLSVRARNAGRVMPGRELRIADPATGDTMGVGETGEICIRGLVMTGYFGMAEESAGALDGEGWLHTGDLGKIDADGYLTVSGRLKDMIIRGGLNVYPREVEDVLIAHPTVAEAAVFGVPDPKWGEIVVAGVRASEGCVPDRATLIDFVSGRIAKYKAPADILLVDAFPLTASGKVKKIMLRDQYLQAFAVG